MSDPNETLRQYVSDMLALEKYILENLERQVNDEVVRKDQRVHQLLSRVQRTFETHVSALDRHLDNLGGDRMSLLKKATTTVTGMVSGVYGKIRSQPASKILRDTSTTLGLTATGYSMLHTTGLALKAQETADIALRHMSDLTPLIVEVSEIIPLIVVEELAQENVAVDATVGPAAVRSTQQAWSPSRTGQQTPTAGTPENPAMGGAGPTDMSGRTGSAGFSTGGSGSSSSEGFRGVSSGHEAEGGRRGQRGDESGRSGQ